MSSLPYESIILMTFIAILLGIICSLTSSYAAYKYWRVTMSIGAAEEHRDFFANLNQGMLLICVAIFFALVLRTGFMTALYFATTYFLLYFPSYKFFWLYKHHTICRFFSPRLKKSRMYFCQKFYA